MREVKLDLKNSKKKKKRYPLRTKIRITKKSSQERQQIPQG